MNSCHETDGFSLTYIHVSPDGSENVTGLDLSDFPALADRSRREGTGNPTPVLNPLAGRAPYGRLLVWWRNLIVSKQNAVQSPPGEAQAPRSADCISVVIPPLCSSSSWHGDQAVD